MLGQKNKTLQREQILRAPFLEIEMSSWLSNISVNLKLALGFGLVLALTCLMAISNWFSLGTLIDRSVLGG